MYGMARSGQATRFGHSCRDGGPAKPPGENEFELTLLGPGYGESIVMHVGGGVWVLVDSCIDTDGTPRALSYLESIGVDPAETVELIVASHWHDDHIRGMAKLFEVCKKAAFCCASALLEKEFLTVVGALENRPLEFVGSGLKEMHGVVSRLRHTASSPTLALANRRVFKQGACEIWSLSPNDSIFKTFLRSIGDLVPSEGQGRTRIPSLSPNEVAVALWVRTEDIAVLLGSDLEKRGWVEILQSAERPDGKSSVFKVPHHGSKSAHEPDVWKRMLDPDPFALLTPWRRGRRALPNQQDVRRILSSTTNAYATAKISSCTRAPVSRKNMVRRTIRESGVKLRRVALSPGAVRLRRPLGSRAGWKVETFGPACHLPDFS